MNTPLRHTLAALLGTLLSLLTPAAQAQTFETLFSDNQGREPYAGLVQGSDGSFYGTTQYGGASGYGSVFKITASGTHTVIHSFNLTGGRTPHARLVQGSDGSFYGTTYYGGANNLGAVFKVTPSGSFTLLHSFNGTNGRYPRSGLVQGSDGDFYGTTQWGGASNYGTVFKITTSGSFTLLHHFNGTNGSYPYGGLVLGSDGLFYGTTGVGGATGNGTVFKITTTGTHTLLHSFNVTNGRYPYGGLVLGSDGSFYGTTNSGGASNNGAVYKITATGTQTLLHSFNNTNGSSPQSELVQGSDGLFYGTTYGGGTGNQGTVFKITAAGAHTLLHSFNGTNGRYSYSTLVQGSDGLFYGTTLSGGASGYGTAFKITSTGTHTLLHSFGAMPNGNSPYDKLVRGSDGSFYGTTYDGGASNNGTIFKITAGGTHTVLHSFNGTQGRNPMAGLVQGSDGLFYGTTRQGGSVDSGTVFKITSTGTFTHLHSFNGTSGGSYPYAGLVQASDGLFYGTTVQGGASSYGTVFRITASGAHAVLHSFNYTNGRNPYARLVQGSDGFLYGTTYQGGASDFGTVFKINSIGTHTLLHSFNNTNGRYAWGGLVQASDGSFYGTTYQGGVSDAGTVFKITATGTHTLLHSFNTTNGRFPYAGLVQGSDGHFYGTTYAGGANGSGGSGTIFKITATGTHTLLHSFDGMSAAFPKGAPTFGTDGNLYGTADQMVVWRYTFDTTAPTLSPVTIASSNANTTRAKLGDTVTVSFTSNEAIQTPTVTLLGVAATVANPSGNNWTATAQVTGLTAQGTAFFSISATDLIGNAASAVTSTTNASSVIVDKSGPTSGSMTLSPDSPVAASSTVTVSFASWTDASPPLQYEVLIDDVVVSAQGVSASRNLTAPATAGTYTLKGRIYDALGNFTESTQSFEVFYTPQQKFDNAMSAAGLTGPDAVLTATPQDDGIANLLKYAFNMDLTAADVRTLTPGSGTAGLPVVTVPAPGIMRMEYLRRIGSGLLYTPQKSTTLALNSWTPFTSTPVVTPIDTNWERVTQDEPFNPTTTPGLFGSVEVTVP